MLRRLLTLLISAALSTAAFAVDEHHPDADKKPVAEKSADQPGKPAQAKTAAKKTATSIYTEKEFSAAREQMKKMLAQMDKIRQTKDPRERQRLMQEHMQTMVEGAQAMRSTGGGMMMDMMNCPMMSDKGGAQNCPMMGGQAGKMDMGKRVDTMENRMDMMQMMMEQMIERESQKSQMP